MSQTEDFKKLCAATGGPAMPLVLEPANGQPNREVFPGMTLRDYFAGQALIGISSMSGDGFGLSAEDEANWAYQRADAMLAARTPSDEREEGQ